MLITYNRVLQSSILLPLIMIVYLIKSSSAIVNDYTNDCIEKADAHDCNVFNKCCQFRCKQSTNRHQFCMALFGQIQPNNTYCQCNVIITAVSNGASESAELLIIGGCGIDRRRRCSSSSKIDAIIAIILLFVADMIMLAFAF